MILKTKLLGRVYQFKSVLDALAKAKAKDEAIAAASAGATYAGDADPYRHDDEEDEADAKDWA